MRRLTRRTTRSSVGHDRGSGNRPAPRPLARLLEAVPGRPVLVLHEPTLAGLVADLGDDVVTVAVGAPLPDPDQRFAGVLLVVRDTATLRRLVPLVPKTGRTRVVGWWVREAQRPVQPALRPEWPEVVEVSGRLTPAGGAVGFVRFASGGPGSRVLAQLARDAGSAAPPTGLHLAVAPGGREGVVPAHGDVLQVAAPEDAVDEELVVPPDVVLTDAEVDLPPHHVLGRPPATVVAPQLPPLDEGVLNPTGFTRHTVPGTRLLGGEGADLRVEGMPELALDDRGATPGLVRDLRPVRGLVVDWTGADEERLAYVVAGLALAGVPLLGGPPPRVRELLGEDLARLLAADVDLDDLLRREEHSIRLRRASFAGHSTVAWRVRLRRAAGLAGEWHPSSSVLLCTRRPERLRFALRQVARQRVPAELVLAAHGFSVDRREIAELAGDREVVVLERPGEELFGSALDAAARAASGDVLTKMDDDDWYGPDFLGDLLQARAYSGADVVGTPLEYVYLEPLDSTVRRDSSSERPVRLLVSGGSLTASRGLVREIGGFRPVHRFVDASFLAAVHAAGGLIYRGHGLNYCYRRTSGWHTWETDLDEFLDEERALQQWPGFRPSDLLTHDPEDVPDRADAD